MQNDCFEVKSPVIILKQLTVRSESVQQAESTVSLVSLVGTLSYFAENSDLVDEKLLSTIGLFFCGVIRADSDCRICFAICHLEFPKASCQSTLYRLVVAEYNSFGNLPRVCTVAESPLVVSL